MGPTEPITAEQLASELGIKPHRVFDLIDHGYVVCAFRTDFPDLTLVERPEPELARWLRWVCRKPTAVPMLPLSWLAGRLRISAHELRELAAESQAEIFFDALFGELVSLTGLHGMMTALKSNRLELATDRQSMLDYLSAVFAIEGADAHRSKPRWTKLSAEIARVSALPMPERVLRAEALWSAYCDARNIIECLTLYKRQSAKHTLRMDEAMVRIKDLLEGKRSWQDRQRFETMKSRPNTRFRDRLTPEEKAEWTALLSDHKKKSLAMNDARLAMRDTLLAAIKGRKKAAREAKQQAAREKASQAAEPQSTG